MQIQINGHDLLHLAAAASGYDYEAATTAIIDALTASIRDLSDREEFMQHLVSEAGRMSADADAGDEGEAAMCFHLIGVEIDRRRRLIIETIAEIKRLSGVPF